MVKKKYMLRDRRKALYATPLIITIIYFLVRIVFLLLMEVLPIEPYFTFDDMELYSTVTIDDVSNDYLITRQFFFIICCYLNMAKIDEVFVLTRLFNIIVFYLFIIEVIRFSSYLNMSKNTCYAIALFFVLAPQFIILSCSLLKDILIMYCLFKSLRTVIAIVERKRQNVFSLIWFSFCVVLLYFLRFGLVELLVLCTVVYLFLKTKHKKIVLFALVPLVCCAAFVVLKNEQYMYWLQHKIDYIFSNKSSDDGGLMNYLRMNSVKEIYKLPFGLLYILIMGIPKLSSLSDTPLLWINIIGFFSFATLFLLPSFYAYFFSKRKTNAEAFCLIYFAIYHIIMTISSPSLFRHILCIIPMFIVFSINNLKKQKKLVLPIMCLLFSSLYFVYFIIQFIV